VPPMIHGMRLEGALSIAAARPAEATATPQLWQ
jgi:hypothetical protein